MVKRERDERPRERVRSADERDKDDSRRDSRGKTLKSRHHHDDSSDRSYRKRHSDHHKDRREQDHHRPDGRDRHESRDPKRKESVRNESSSHQRYEELQTDSRRLGLDRREDRRKEAVPPPTKVVKTEPEETVDLGCVKKEPGIEDEEASPAPPPPEKPNFGLSGKLTAETNTYNGIVVKYSEPPEARKPKRRWRFYVFKGEETLPTLYLHRQSAYLLGRERKVADIPVDHPSCSKQQAVLQFRTVSYERPDGTQGRTVRPYIIDLESANGTYVNSKRIESSRYVELFEKDVLKFGFSSREYVLLHEDSKAQAELDDDGQD